MRSNRSKARRLRPGGPGMAGCPNGEARLLCPAGKARHVCDGGDVSNED